jgi:glycerol-3-phosphate cytidylyltransferase
MLKLRDICSAAARLNEDKKSAEVFMDKFSIGFTQGTFDMFHIGHLNVIRAASERCERLIVGVNSDSLVKKYKGKNTIVPEIERLAIVSALIYVDESVITNTLDKTTLHGSLHFNAVFIGDDWKGSERWDRTEKELFSIGVRVVYLPYTKNTSSTALREKISDF